MTAHLLLITLGPVQDFIAQARRTRDLWFGSHILSELSRTAAHALVRHGAKLIFPPLQNNDPELTECLGPLRENGEPSQNIANKLLAEIPDGVDPKKLAQDVRKAVGKYWREKATEVKKKCADLLASGIENIWTEQIDTFLEFSASWSPLVDYAKARHEIEHAVANRKLLRDFDRWQHGRGNVPKSSLDGARETVLAPAKERSSRGRELARRYRISDGEQLDAIGLVKRAGGDPEQFVPITTVASATWLEHAAKIAPTELQNLKRACSEKQLSRIDRGDLSWVRHLPFEGGVLFPGRWQTIFEELENSESDNSERRREIREKSNAWGQKYVQPLFQKLPEPYPYIACLVADGDRMGQAIDSIKDPDTHREFSKKLANFAGEARKIVEQKYLGSLVYAGGDDVLAFVSLPQALVCADALRKAFESAMQEACANLEGKPPTLSVGLGIGHITESMGELLALGRQAEREAKQDRNALAIVLEKRSGGTHVWRAPWSEDPVQQMESALSLMQNRMPSRKVYEIAKILTRLPQPSIHPGDEWARVLELEVKRSLSRIESSGLQPMDVGLKMDSKTQYSELHSYIEKWVKCLLIARVFDQTTIREHHHEEAAR